MANLPCLKMVFLVCLLSTAGCATLPESAHSASWLKRRPNLDEQAVQLIIALIERPLGDPFLNEGLWQYTDEMIMELDRKAMLQDNGFRVGQIVGMTPGDLQSLLKSERYCSNPRQRLLASGNSAPLYLGPAWPHCEYSLQLENESKRVAVDEARFCFDVKATLTRDGKTRLAFTPKVENGELALPFEPDPQQQEWKLRVERPAKRYPELTWEVALAPGEFLVVGGILAKEQSLGHRSFIQDDGTSLQRLLVLRTSRAATTETAEPGVLHAGALPSPCLAEQASMGAVRARGE